MLKAITKTDGNLRKFGRDVLGTNNSVDQRISKEMSMLTAAIVKCALVFCNGNKTKVCELLGTNRDDLEIIINHVL